MKKIVIIVDVQNDFVNGALGTFEAQMMIPNLLDEMNRRADKDTCFIFTRDTHDIHYMSSLEGKNLPVPHCIKDTDGWEIYPDVLKEFDRIADKTFMINGYVPVINKPTFGSTELQHFLTTFVEEEDDIAEITLMGLCTGICVMSNALLCKATLPEVPVNVVADCCACVTPETHETALNAMKLCQINII